MNYHNSKKSCPRPWTPVKAEDNGNKCTFDVWGRRYTVDATPFFSSIISQGQELLNGPMRIVSCENGEASVWSDCEVFLMDGNDAESATVVSTMCSNAFYINTSMTVEFDGCVKAELKIMPRGHTVKQVFFGAGEMPKFHLDSLWLEIPLKKSSARFFQMYPKNEIRFSDGTVKPNNGFATGGDVFHGTTYFPFETQLFLCNDNVGLGCLFESAENWQPKDKTSFCECIETEDEVLLRFHMLDSHPRQWVEKGTADVHLFRPICFDIGFQVTPFKEYPADPYTEHNVHIDCFKKLDEDYETFLSKSFVKDDGTDTGETGFDRLKRLGVNTLYIHEKWNTCQNSPWLTKKAASRLKFIIDECHKRNIKLIPYFGYEMSALSPEWETRIAEAGCNRTDGKVGGMWNRVPYQRDGKVCCKSSWTDTFPEGVAYLMDTFGFDGIYIDGTVTPWACANESHGCGYRDENGELQPTYPLWACREMMKRLYQVVDSRGGTINCHTAGCYNLAGISLSHSIWEGEVTQFMMIKGNETHMPEGIFRGQFSGRLLGMPLFMLCYANPPVWTFEHSNAFSLLLGTIPKAVDMDLPLEGSAKLWEILDKFPIAKSTWHPYWENDSRVTSSNENVKVSYYEYNDVVDKSQLLVFASNTVIDNIENWSISANGTITELLPNKGVTFENTVLPQCMKGFDYKIFAIELK